jgi:predicted amidohydrolase YtcJ
MAVSRPAASAWSEQDAELVVYPARLVRTLDPARPTAQAVAVQGDRIRAVGTLDELAAYGPARVDDRYADRVLLPGFVEAHSHASGGGLWRWPYLGYSDRTDPAGTSWPGCTTVADILRRLREADARLADPDEPLIAWGMDPIFYPGDRLAARHLDGISARRPIYIQHQSFHHATVNTALMRRDGITRDTAVPGVLRDGRGEPVGELAESAAMALARSVPSLLGGGLDAAVLREFARDARNQGVTTAVDLGNPDLMSDAAVGVYQDTAAAGGFPIRLAVAALAFGAGGGAVAPARELADRLVSLRDQSTDQVRFGIVKFILDGTIQGFTARVEPPGYLRSAARGVWVCAPEDFRAAFGACHAAGLQVHAHCNGDQATELFLDVVEDSLRRQPRWDHRHTVTHSQLSTAAQYRRMAALGVGANIFANHIWAFGDMHLDVTLGPDRAARMNAAATALRCGVPISLHSDSPVTPLGPLATMKHAVTRRTQSGRVLGELERISSEQALRAVTTGAAYLLKLDAEVGSIEAGKFADLAVLARDPLAVEPETLPGIEVLGTVLGGQHHPSGRAG